MLNETILLSLNSWASADVHNAANTQASVPETWL